jgi:hypothetical protein
VLTIALSTSAAGTTGQGLPLGSQPGAAPIEPPRDGQAAVVGTGRVRGRVLAADTGRPLRRAVVRLSSPSSRDARIATTDEYGRYEFADLPPATYTVSATRTGYLQMQYGQKVPNGTRDLVAIRPGETRQGVDITLLPAAVITGRVVDEIGDPVADVQVMARRRQTINGASRTTPVGVSMPTNDIGEFRLFGLAPGEYVVVASPARQFGPFDVNTGRTGFAPTYYPRTADPSAAQTLTLRGGETVAGVLIGLLTARLARVSGTALDAERQPMRGGSVSAMVRDAPQMIATTTPIGPDGSFAFPGLPPGSYTLRGMIPPRMPGPMLQLPAASVATVAVDGQDLAGIVLEPAQPVVVSGRVNIPAPALGSVSAGGIGVIATRLDPPDMSCPFAPPSPLRDDFSFEIPACPGRTALRVTAPGGLLLRSVQRSGTDVTTGFDVPDAGVLDGITIELTDEIARVAVTVRNGRGEPFPGADVLVFSVDETRWGAATPGFSITGRTGAEGRYEGPPLLPGTYYVAAVDGIDVSMSTNPEFLTSLTHSASRVAIAAGETRTVDVTLGDR